MKNPDFLSFKTVSGQPFSVGRFTLTPQARVLTVRLPFGAFVWNQAKAVLVKEAGQTKTYPIVDLTRLVRLALTGSTLLLIIIMSLLTRKRREETSK